MSQIEVTAGPAIQAPPIRSAAVSRSNANGPLMWSLLALLVLSPLPFGSARPFFWSFSAAYLGVVTFLYFGSLLLSGGRPRVTTTALLFPSILCTIFVGFLVLQMLPIGDWIGAFRIENFAGAPLSSESISIAPGATLMMLLRQLAYATFFMLMLQVAANRSRRRFVLKIVLWSILLYGIYGMVSLQTGDTILGVKKWAYLGSATGPFINRNSFATYLAFGGVVSLALFIGELRKISMPETVGRVLVSNLFIYAITYTVLLLIVVATNSRMGLAVTLAGSLVVLLSGLIHGGARRGPVLAFLGLAGLGLAAALLYLSPGMVDRIGSVEMDALARTNLYQQVWEMILARPMLGYGGGTFELAFPLFHRPPVDVDFIWNRSHNTYLALWSDMGLVIGSIPIVVMVYFGWRIMRTSLRNKAAGQPSEDWLAQTVAVAVIVLSAIHSLADFSLEIQANTFVFLALVACGASSTFQVSQQVEPSKWQ